MRPTGRRSQRARPSQASNSSSTARSMISLAPEPGELRQRLPRVLADPHGEQPVDPLLDLRRRRYGTPHGVGPPSTVFAGREGTYAVASTAPRAFTAALGHDRARRPTLLLSSQEGLLTWALARRSGRQLVGVGSDRCCSTYSAPEEWLSWRRGLLGPRRRGRARLAVCGQPRPTCGTCLGSVSDGDGEGEGPAADGGGSGDRHRAVGGDGKRGRGG